MAVGSGGRWSCDSNSYKRRHSSTSGRGSRSARPGDVRRVQLQSSHLSHSVASGSVREGLFVSEGGLWESVCVRGSAESSVCDSCGDQSRELGASVVRKGDAVRELCGTPISTWWRRSRPSSQFLQALRPDSSSRQRWGSQMHRPENVVSAAGRR